MERQLALADYFSFEIKILMKDLSFRGLITTPIATEGNIGAAMQWIQCSPHRIQTMLQAPFAASILPIGR